MKCKRLMEDHASQADCTNRHSACWNSGRMERDIDSARNRIDHGADYNHGSYYDTNIASTELRWNEASDQEASTAHQCNSVVEVLLVSAVLNAMVENSKMALGAGTGQLANQTRESARVTKTVYALYERLADCCSVSAASVSRYGFLANFMLGQRRRAWPIRNEPSRVRRGRLAAIYVRHVLVECGRRICSFTRKRALASASSEVMDERAWSSSNWCAYALAWNAISLGRGGMLKLEGVKSE